MAKIIAAMGVPGSGKSSTFKALGKLLLLDTYCEPEEAWWHNPNGDLFTKLQLLRSHRVLNLKKAEALRRIGISSLVDSCYDILLNYYIGNSSVEWFFKPTTPYSRIIKDLAKLDCALLPAPDCIVFFKINYNLWVKRLETRDRFFDTYKGMLGSFWEMQTDMLKATEAYCKERQSRLILFEQEDLPISTLAFKLGKNFVSVNRGEN